jgi:predicted oxidoreductase
MTFSSEIQLRKAIRDGLLANSALVAKLGGARVYDEAPREQASPYVVFARSEARDWSTMTEAGCEHLLTLEVWSQKAGAREALEIAGCIADVLQDAPMALSGATCVNLRVVSIETLRQNANRFVRARLKLRALVETEH